MFELSHWIILPIAYLVAGFLSGQMTNKPLPDTATMVGQLLMVAPNSTNLTTSEFKQLKIRPFGNFLLMGGNIGSDEQVKELTASLSASNHLPVWIATDQEGGEVVRVKTDPTASIGQPSLTDPHQAQRVARVRGQHLLSLGINLPLSPVVDHVTSTRAGLHPRAFSQDWSVLGRAMALGYSEAGVTPVFKHFPSYGDLPGDVEADIPSKLLTPTEIATFRTLLPNALVVMISPVVIDNIDPALPAPLSTKVINFLRHELGFTGVLITDDAAMRAVTKHYQPHEFAVDAIEAGVDMVMFTGDWSEASLTFDRLIELAENDSRWRQRVEMSYRRVIRHKNLNQKLSN